MLFLFYLVMFPFQINKMTQDEALKVLKKEKDWITTREVAERININPTTVSRNLLRLYLSNEALRKKIMIKNKGYLWKIK